MKKLFKMMLIVSLATLVSLGTSNIKAAVAESSNSSTTTELPAITSVGIKPDTPTKVVNSQTYVTNGQTLEFNLLDMYGKPTGWGNYSGLVTLSGSAFFNFYGKITQTAELKLKNGQGKITFYVTNDVFPGEITVTPHFKNLLNKPFTEKLYIPGLSGNATQVVLSDQPSPTQFSADTLGSVGANPFLTYNLQAEDAEDNPTAANAPTGVIATVTHNGKPATDVVAIPTVSENGSYSVMLKLINEVTQGSPKIPAGTYTVTITPEATAKTTFNPLTETFTITSEEP